MAFQNPHSGGGLAVRRHPRASGFTLVELLTVVFIIGLLIGILIPSLTAARNAAKKTVSAAAIKGMGAALEAFKNDLGKDFRQTNGYPPSYAHPPISNGTGGYVFDRDNAMDGLFPFMPSAEGQTGFPVIYGAHWLPAMLLGVDSLGVVARKTVPAQLRAEPWKWYAADPFETGGGPLERSPLYADPESLKLVRTEDLPGVHPSDFFPNWEDMKSLPVVVDAFDQPILYYVSNTYGRTRNMVEEERNRENDYDDKPPPYYFHQDNKGFTGTGVQAADEKGWDLGGGRHWIARSGHDLTAMNIDEATDDIVTDNTKTFAHFILDRQAFGALSEEDLQLESAPLKPYNMDGYLLISAGRDARYGSADDVVNFPLGQE